MALLHRGQQAHLADARARFGKEKHADKEGFLKYFLALANKEETLVFQCNITTSEKKKQEQKRLSSCLLNSSMLGVVTAVINCYPKYRFIRLQPLLSLTLKISSAWPHT